MGGNEGTLLQVPGVLEGDLGGGLERVEVTSGRFTQLAVFFSACFMSAINVTIMSPVWSDAEQVRRAAAGRVLADVARRGLLSPSHALNLQRFHVGERKVNRLANLWNIWGACARGAPRVRMHAQSRLPQQACPAAWARS